MQKSTPAAGTGTNFIPSEFTNGASFVPRASGAGAGGAGAGVACVSTRAGAAGLGAEALAGPMTQRKPAYRARTVAGKAARVDDSISGPQSAQFAPRAKRR